MKRYLAIALSAFLPFACGAAPGSLKSHAEYWAWVINYAEEEAEQDTPMERTPDAAWPTTRDTGIKVHPEDVGSYYEALVRDEYEKAENAEMERKLDAIIQHEQNLKTLKALKSDL